MLATYYGLLQLQPWSDMMHFTRLSLATRAQWHLFQWQFALMVVVVGLLCRSVTLSESPTTVHTLITPMYLHIKRPLVRATSCNAYYQEILNSHLSSCGVQESRGWIQHACEATYEQCCKVHKIVFSMAVSMWKHKAAYTAVNVDSLMCLIHGNDRWATKQLVLPWRKYKLSKPTIGGATHVIYGWWFQVYYMCRNTGVLYYMCSSTHAYTCDTFGSIYFMIM